MTRNAASTSRHVAGGRPSVADASGREAADLVEQADEIFGRYLQPGQWPTARTARRFLTDGDLEHVLGLYMQAMESDPEEAAYPWNLAAALDRLRLSDLALVFIRRAIRVAGETGDREWAGADALLALADIAMNAGRRDTAKEAIQQARTLDPDSQTERYLRRLQDEPAVREGTPRIADQARSTLSSRLTDELAIFERSEVGTP